MEEIFENRNPLEIVINIRNVENGNYIVRKSLLNPENGSLISKIKAIGPDTEINIDDYHNMIRNNVPASRYNSIAITQGRMMFQKILRGNDILLIRISK